MKYSEHFLRDTLVLRPFLRFEWCEQVIREPERTEEQDDGRVRHWGYIPELGHYLRVVTEADRETVVTAFPDGRFRGLQS